MPQIGRGEEEKNTERIVNLHFISLILTDFQFTTEVVKSLVRTQTKDKQ